EEARRSLQTINNRFGSISPWITNIFEASPDLERSQTAADVILDQSPKIMEQTAQVSETINGLGSKRLFTGTTAMIAFFVTLFSAFMIGLSSYRNSRQAQEVEKDKRKRQEESIMQLLNEL